MIQGTSVQLCRKTAVILVIIGLVFGIGLVTQRAYGDGYPTATQYVAKGAHWKAKNAKTYLYAKKTSSTKKHHGRTIKVTNGLVRLGKKYYYFDAKGVQRTGWKRVGPSYYAFFKRANGKKGYLVQSKAVEGIKLDDRGFAELNDTNLPELELYVKANDLVEKATKPRWSSARKLKACFDYFATYKRWSFRVTREYTDFTTQHVEYALDILDPDRGEGDCDSWAAAFTYVAVALGHPDALFTTAENHSWTEIDGRIYDPQRSIKHSRVFGIGYYELPEKNSYPKYLLPHTSYRIFPEQSTWDGTPVARVHLTGSSSLVSFSGKRYLASKRGYASNKLASYNSNRYFFKKDGTAATGAYRVKDDDDESHWLVFNSDGTLSTGASVHTVSVDGIDYLATSNGEAFSGEYQGHFYLPNGRPASGIQFADGSFYAVRDDGTVDAQHTDELNNAAVQGRQAQTLLSLLGTPENTSEAASCLNYQGYEGTDVVYQYDGFTVQTFKCPEVGEVYWSTY